MRKIISLLLILALTTSLAVTFLPVKAEPKTITVPDDYPTISSAIGNATAGDTIFVKRGTYENPKDETLMIDKPISLIGEDANTTIINLYPAYNVTWILTQSFIASDNAIKINADDVTISNFTIVPFNHGEISVNGERTHIIGNKIVGSNYETSVHVKGSFCVLDENIVSSLILENSHSSICNNTIGTLQLGGVSHISSNNNVISGNNFTGGRTYHRGIYIVLGSHNVFYDNYIANYCSWGDVTDGFGVEFRSFNDLVWENNTFYHNNFINNYRNVVIESSSFINFWDNGREGNFWGDYNGTDSNKDGIGNTPYIINSKNIDNYPLMKPYDIENDTLVLPPPEPFPSELLIVPAALVVSIGIVLLVYRKKTRKNG